MTECLTKSMQTTTLHTLINRERWASIQITFPQEIKNRRENKTAQLISESIASYNLTGVADATYKKIFLMPSTADDMPSISEPGASFFEWIELKRAEKAKKKAEREFEEELSLTEIEPFISNSNTGEMNYFIISFFKKKTLCF